MSRRRAREFALQALYQADISERNDPKDIGQLWGSQVDGGMGDKAADEDEIAFSAQIISGVLGRREEIDGLIETVSKNWRITRMPVVDRNILRLATFELMACEDVPASVCINEAVELAKRFGDKESRAFINGILDRIASDLGRGGRKRKG
jgi:N utilization substance protein B